MALMMVMEMEIVMMMEMMMIMMNSILSVADMVVRRQSFISKREIRLLLQAATLKFASTHIFHVKD
eukprot:251273-Hanusia_phi.AAC.1